MSKINLQAAINLAAQSGEVGLIAQFREAGADINLEHGGLTPLLAAIKSDSYNAVNETIRLGADVDASNVALLRTAISQKNPYIVELLLRKGASVEGRERYFTDLAYAEVAGADDDEDLSMAQHVISIIVEASVASLASARARELGPDCDFFDLAG